MGLSNGLCNDVNLLNTNHWERKMTITTQNNNKGVSLSFRVLDYSQLHAFRFFATEAYASHPWHHHYQNLSDIFEEIDESYTIFSDLCEEYFTIIRVNNTETIRLREDKPIKKLYDGRKDLKNELYWYAKEIRDMLLLLQDNFYSKRWAVNVAIKYADDTNKHCSRAIDIMFSNKRIPIKSKGVLTNLIRLKKSDQFYIEDEWKPVGNNRRRGIALAMVPMEHANCEIRGQWYQRDIPDAIDTIKIYKPAKLIYLGDYFGVRRDIRLYFSPRQFPTPIDLRDGDNCDEFDRLTNYIIEQSKKEGEVKISYRYTETGRCGCGVKFACKTKGCKFNFMVKWDHYGYYIYHFDPNSSRKVWPVQENSGFVGCVEHNHGKEDGRLHSKKVKR